MTRHLLMDPAFPDLVAAAAAEEAAARCSRVRRSDDGPPIVAGLLRLLARLW